MSKVIWQHPDIPTGEKTRSWRSIGQLEDTPAFREWLGREFPQGAAEMAGEGEMETSRRSFLKLMGASTALAGFGVAACRQPEKYILPYTKSPEWVIPGKATYYATSMPRATGATPLVVTTFEGRPTKLAPNTLHPDAAGTDSFAQASVLDLYSTSRSRRVLKQGKPAARADFEAALATLAADPAAKLGFLFGQDESPTRSRLAKLLGQKFASARFYQYEALAGEAAKALPDGVKLVADFSKADRILSLDCDFAGADPQGPVTPFFQRRKPEGQGYEAKPDQNGMNRLYCVESAYSLTGGMADHRLRVTPSEIVNIAGAIAKSIGHPQGSSFDAPSDPKIGQWISAMVNDLKQHMGRSLVVAGSRQPAAVHHLALALNLALANVGPGKPLVAGNAGASGWADLSTLLADIQAGAVEHLVLLTPANPLYDAPADLDVAAAFGKLKTLIQHGDRTHATALSATWHVPAAHYLEAWSDARSANGYYSIVQPMILPLYPDSVSEIELLLAFLSQDGKIPAHEGADGAPSAALAAVRESFAAVRGDDEASWKKLLRDGFSPDTAYPQAGVNPLASAEAHIAEAQAAARAAAGTLQVVFSTDYSVFDGRWIDNPWLQENPDPISKLSWDNAALIAPKTAKKLGIYDQILATEPETTTLVMASVPATGKFAAVGPDGEGEHRKSPVIEVSVNGKKLEIPVLISFGQAEDTLVIPLGYGQGINADDELGRKPRHQDCVGMVGMNRGFDAYPLRTSATPYYASGATVKTTDRRYHMALTQEHSSMYGRALAREVSTMEDEEKGDFARQLANVSKQGSDSHAPPNISLYKPQGSKTWHPDKNGDAPSLLPDDRHQWGMSIDLSACMGCTACSVACQAENNIPIVGKEQLAKGREMLWIRMDRYYAAQEGNTFDADNPAFVPQPVACVQCESAPCETVCPVNATVHTEDGLNAMAYNRCIGTRYCANNCPYKARRFNFFDYNKRNPLIPHNLNRGPLGKTQVGEADHLQRNPNVTVRMRGVMEKCTYCVQRLKDSVIRQKQKQKEQVFAAGRLSPEVPVPTVDLRVPVDGVKVACQEACPADAISFGNLLDDKSQGAKADSTVVRAKSIARNYDLLNYLGTRPRTSYLARVKNPNPAMPDAPFIGKATIHMA